MSSKIILSPIELDMLNFLRENLWEITLVGKSAIDLKQDNGIFSSEVSIGASGWVSRTSGYLGKREVKASIFSGEIEVYAGLIKDYTKA